MTTTTRRIFQLRTGEVTLDGRGRLVATHDLCGEIARVDSMERLRAAIAKHLNVCAKFEWPVLPSFATDYAWRPVIGPTDIILSDGPNQGDGLVYGVITTASPVGEVAS